MVSTLRIRSQERADSASLVCTHSCSCTTAHFPLKLTHRVISTTPEVAKVKHRRSDECTRMRPCGATLTAGRLWLHLAAHRSNTHNGCMHPHRPHRGLSVSAPDSVRVLVGPGAALVVVQQ